MVKHLLAMRETWNQSLGEQDPLEKEMATYSSTLAWKIPWIKEPAGYIPWGHKESDMTERLHFTFGRMKLLGQDGSGSHLCSHLGRIARPHFPASFAVGWRLKRLSSGCKNGFVHLFQVKRTFSCDPYSLSPSVG